jgi:hypothetical protein
MMHLKSIAFSSPDVEDKDRARKSFLRNKKGFPEEAFFENREACASQQWERAQRVSGTLRSTTR